MIEVDVTKRLQTSSGIRDVRMRFAVGSKEFFALYGASGCGKTTTLRMLAGLTKPDSGSIIVNGEYWYSDREKIDKKASTRGAGFVFQDYALFPTMTVWQNMTYAARGDHTAINRLLDITELTSLKQVLPARLSGGQRQRLALARALVNNPAILLLDEPLSAIDPLLRLRMQDLLAELHQSFGVTIVMVSHDLSEIHKLAHQVAVFNEQGIYRTCPPADLFAATGSAKFRLTATVLSVERTPLLAVVTVCVGTQIAKIVLDPDDALGLEPGVSVLIATKAFAPVVVPLNDKEQF